MRKRLLALTLAFVMLTGVMAACQSASSPSTSSSASTNTSSSTSTSPSASTSPSSSASTSTVTKDTLVIATANETPSMHTADHNAVAGSYMNQMTHNGLFRDTMDLQVEPHLVESFETLSDTEWQMKLHPGIKFHNGETMTSADVKASLEWAKGYSVVTQYTKSIKEVNIIDDLTFVIVTNGPQSSLLNDLAHHGNYIVPKSLIDSGNDFNKNPIGAGPYKFVAWTLGEKIDFEAFDEYFLESEKPTIKNVTWKIIPEGSSRTIALESGQIDLIIEVETTDYNRIKTNNKLGLYEITSSSHNFMMVNNELAPFNNADVRKALNAAIDKESVLVVALNGFGEVALSQAPSGFLASSTVNADTYDPVKAKEYLAASGVDPASIKLPLICSDDTKKRAGEIIQANLKENLGIDVEIVSMDLATYLEETRLGNYTAAIGGFTSASILGYAQGVYDSSSVNASNKTRMNYPEVDALIRKAEATLDYTERDVVLKELVELVNKLNPQVPLYQPLMLRAYNADLKNVQVSPNGTMYYAKLSW